MCARYTREADSVGIAAVFDLTDDLEDDDEESTVFAPTWNAAPGTDQLIFLRRPGRGPSRRVARWGLRLRCADRTLVNARAESVHSRPTLRESFRRHRCVVPATGFYEWSRLGGRRLPSLFVVGDRRVFAMAGIWSPADAGGARHFCVLTTESNDTVAAVHDRMPVILHDGAVRTWLDPNSEPDSLRELMVPYAGPMDRWRVSPSVNRTTIDGPELVDRWSDPQLTLFGAG